MVVRKPGAKGPHLLSRPGSRRIAGCACADDPTPEPEFQEYAELDIMIERADGKATIRIRE